jgi:DNA repair protein RadC
MADIIRPALLTNAVSMILVHNHPSGGRASVDDRRFTKDAKKAAKLFGIRLLDHIIIGDSGFESLQEKFFRRIKNQWIRGKKDE